MNLRVTDGTTTVVLSGTAPVLGCRYFPATPEVDEGAVWGYRETVVETCEVALAGTASAVRAAVREVEVLLETARRRQRQGAGARVWVEYEAVAGEGYWRSEVLSGRVAWSDAPGLRRLDAPGPRVVVGVTWTRRWFWEGALTQAALTSGPTTPATTGYVTVYNADDANATNQNWFQVAGAQVTGTLPTPAQLDIQNASGGTRYVSAVWVGNYGWMDPTGIDPIYRGEEAQSPGATKSWTGTAETLTHRWALADALAADVDGQYARVVVAFSSPPGQANTLARAKLQAGFGGLYFDLAVGEQVRVGGLGVVDLGAIALPPGRSGTQNADLFLALTMAAPIGSHSATVDWVQALPAGAGVVRRLEGLGLGFEIADGEGMMDDGPEGLVWVYAGADRYALLRGVGGPLHVWPGVTQRMRLVIGGGTGGVQAGQAWEVKMWYRPRRLAV